MIEVKAVIEFVTPCLGNVRNADMDTFERDGSGSIVFYASWWRTPLLYGANCFGKHQDKIGDVRIDAIVDGVPKYWDRPYKSGSSGGVKRHEAFIAGDRITVSFMLPDGISVHDFTEILSYAGRYEGFSPYRGNPGDSYGQFFVVDVAPNM